MPPILSLKNKGSLRQVREHFLHAPIPRLVNGKQPTRPTKSNRSAGTSRIHSAGRSGTGLTALELSSTTRLSEPSFQLTSSFHQFFRIALHKYYHSPDKLVNKLLRKLTGRPLPMFSCPNSMIYIFYQEKCDILKEQDRKSFPLIPYAYAAQQFDGIHFLC